MSQHRRRHDKCAKGPSRLCVVLAANTRNHKHATTTAMQILRTRSFHVEGDGKRWISNGHNSSLFALGCLKMRIMQASPPRALSLNHNNTLHTTTVITNITQTPFEHRHRHNRHPHTTLNTATHYNTAKTHHATPHNTHTHATTNTQPTQTHTMHHTDNTRRQTNKHHTLNHTHK